MEKIVLNFGVLPVIEVNNLLVHSRQLTVTLMDEGNKYRVAVGCQALQVDKNNVKKYINQLLNVTEELPVVKAIVAKNSKVTIATKSNELLEESALFYISKSKKVYPKDKYEIKMLPIKDDVAANLFKVNTKGGAVFNGYNIDKKEVENLLIVLRTIEKVFYPEKVTGEIYN